MTADRMRRPLTDYPRLVHARATTWPVVKVAKNHANNFTDTLRLTADRRENAQPSLLSGETSRIVVFFDSLQNIHKKCTRLVSQHSQLHTIGFTILLSAHDVRLALPLSNAGDRTGHYSESTGTLVAIGKPWATV